MSHDPMSLSDSQELEVLRAALQEWQMRYQQLSESKMIGIFSWNYEGQISEANDTFLEMVGYSRQDLSEGRIKWRDLTPPEYQEQDEIAFERLKNEGDNKPIEKQFFHKRSHRVDVLIGGHFCDETFSSGVAFVLDISERKRIERQAKQKDERFLRALNASTVGMVHWRMDNTILDVNDAFLQMLGYTREEFERDGFYWRDLTPREYWDLDEKAGLDLFEKGYFEPFEKQYFHKDGGRVDVLVDRTFCPKGEEEGVALIIDITQRKRDERAIQESKQNLLNAQRLANLGSWEIDLTTNKVYFSDELYRIQGRAPGGPLVREELINRVHPDDRQRLLDTIREAQNGGKRYTLEYRLRLPDGAIKTVRSQGEVDFNEEGTPVRIRGAVLDITEHKEAEKALIAMMNRQEALLNNIPDIAWMKDRESRYIAINDAFAKFVRMSREELIHKTDLDVMPEALALKYRQDDRYVMQTGERIKVEEEIEDPDGHIIWVETIKSPIFDSDGQIVGTTGVARDITNRKRSSELLEKKVAERTAELEAANRTLKENERLRSTFVSSLTHDLRTPVIAQRRLAELLLDQFQVDRDDQDKVDFLIQGLLQNNENLLDMVNKLLETYQYAEGKMVLELEYFNLYELVEECYDTLREVAKIKRIQLLNHVSLSLAYLHADRALLTRVFINLLGNAIENIPEGSTVQIHAKELENGILVEVEDNGLGIEPEFLPYMFDRYSPRSRRRQKLGSGLGLFICKTILELHGGTISVSSEVGKGAVFSMQFLRQPPNIPQVNSELEPS